MWNFVKYDSLNFLAFRIVTKTFYFSKRQMFIINWRHISIQLPIKPLCKWNEAWHKYAFVKLILREPFMSYIKVEIQNVIEKSLLQKDCNIFDNSRCNSLSYFLKGSYICVINYTWDREIDKVDISAIEVALMLRPCWFNTFLETDKFVKLEINVKGCCFSFR